MEKKKKEKEEQLQKEKEIKEIGNETGTSNSNLSSPVSPASNLYIIKKEEIQISI